MDKQRTLKQNKAMHKWFELLSNELNQAGLDVRRTLRQDIDIPWSPYLIKELIFKKVLQAHTGKTSTTQMTTKEIDTILNTITRYLGEKHGITCDWPSVESMLNNTLTNPGGQETRDGERG